MLRQREARRKDRRPPREGRRSAVGVKMGTSRVDYTWRLLAAVAVLTERGQVDGLSLLSTGPSDSRSLPRVSGRRHKSSPERRRCSHREAGWSIAGPGECPLAPPEGRC